MSPLDFPRLGALGRSAGFAMAKRVTESLVDYDEPMFTLETFVFPIAYVCAFFVFITVIIVCSILEQRGHRLKLRRTRAFVTRCADKMRAPFTNTRDSTGLVFKEADFVELSLPTTESEPGYSKLSLVSTDSKSNYSKLSLPTTENEPEYCKPSLVAALSESNRSELSFVTAGNESNCSKLSFVSTETSTASEKEDFVRGLLLGVELGITPFEVPFPES